MRRLERVKLQHVPVEFLFNIEKRRIYCIFNITYVLCRQLSFGLISLSLKGVGSSQ